MTAWQVRYLVNAVKGVLPFQSQLHALKRRIKGAQTTIVQDQAMEDAMHQVRVINAGGLPVAGSTVLEIGSGWYPVAPLVFRAAGAEKVVLSDMHRLLHPTTLAAAIDHVSRAADKVGAAIGIGPEEVKARITPPAGLSDSEVMAWLGFEYNAPFDLAKCPPIDIVTSHTVLEHIRPDQLKGLLVALKDKLTPKGLMSHGVDHSDHRAHQDPRLTSIDFLRYSDRTWDLLHINPQDYTNRLRHPDYLRLFDEAGYEVEVTQNILGKGLLERAGEVPLWGRFAEMDVQDVVTMWTHYLLRPKGR